MTSRRRALTRSTNRMYRVGSGVFGLAEPATTVCRCEQVAASAIRDAVDVPILANMTEFGKSELFTVDQLASVGVNMVIYPVSLLRSAMGAAERTLEAIKADGTQEAQVSHMLTRARLYDLVDYEAYNRFDAGVFNFQVPGQ